MSIAHSSQRDTSPLQSPSTELWRRKPGTAVLFDNASHKPSAQSASRRATTLLRTLAEAGWHPRRIDAYDIGMKRALATLRESDADLVLAFGGDGTVAACAEIAVDRDLPLLPIPGGTMNLTAKDLGVWEARAELVDMSMLSIEHRVDVAGVNGRTFLHSLATGLVPAIGRQREAFRSRRGIAGRCAAVADAARIALTLERQSIELRTGNQSARARSLSIIVSINRRAT
ncbi:MAG: diacylglycerol kinase family protein, partial [Planctomycetota bacterium]